MLQRGATGCHSTQLLPPSRCPSPCLPQIPARRQGDESGVTLPCLPTSFPHIPLPPSSLRGCPSALGSAAAQAGGDLGVFPSVKNSLRFIFWQHGKPPGRPRGSSRAGAGRGGGGRARRAGNNPRQRLPWTGRRLRCEQCVVHVETPRTAATAPAPSILRSGQLPPPAPHGQGRMELGTTWPSGRWLCPWQGVGTR